LIDELQQTLPVAELDDGGETEITEITNLLRANLDKISQHGKRADSIVKNMLLHSREGSGDHRPADINAIVEKASIWPITAPAPSDLDSISSYSATSIPRPA